MKEEYEKLNSKLQLTIEYNSQNREKSSSSSREEKPEANNNNIR